MDTIFVICYRPVWLGMAIILHILNDRLIVFFLPEKAMKQRQIEKQEGFI